MPTNPDPEAVEVPPWQPEHGPRPHVRTWPRGHRPIFAIHIRGQWRTCPLIARHDYPDGRNVVQVDVHLDSDTSYVARTYRWDPSAMYVLVDGDPPFEA